MNLLNKTLQPIVRFFRGKRFFYPRERLFREHTKNFRNSILLMRIFYGYSLISAIDSYNWLSMRYADKIFYAPLWIFGPLSPKQIQYFVFPILGGWIIGSLLCFFYYERREFRLLQFFSVFFLIGLINSDGHFSNSSHAFLWMSLLLVFIPLPGNKTNSSLRRSERHQLILWTWFVHFMICFFYTMTGYWKLISITNCAVNPALDCQLDQWILTNLSAREVIFYNHFSPWRDAFFKYPWVSFVSYMATIWIHMASLFFAFRLDLHRLFGVLRLVFHLGTFLFFGVNFSFMAIPVGLIFLLSPFDRRQSPLTLLHEFLRLPPMSWLYLKGNKQ